MLGIIRPAFPLFALFLGFVVAVPTTTTNAARFKQALGQLKPENIFSKCSTVAERGGFTLIRWDGKNPQDVKAEATHSLRAHRESPRPNALDSAYHIFRS